MPDPKCPCGSGKRFSKCCGSKPAPAASERPHPSFIDMREVPTIGEQRVKVIPGSTYQDNSTIVIVPGRDPMVHHRVLASWQGMIQPMNQPRPWLYCFNDEVGVAYTNLVKQILADPQLSKFKFIMTVETDNLQPPDAQIRLLETIHAGAFDGVSGIYWTKGDVNMPMCYGDPDEYRRTGILDFRPRDIRSALERGHVIECNGIANGCSLYRMDLFREIEPPWFETLSDMIPGKGVAMMTQDLNFCAKARRKGKRFAVDTRVKVGHLDVNTGVVY